MNTLDAIISIVILLFVFGVIIGAIISTRNQMNEFSFGEQNKIGAMQCAFIIESIYSNSADNFGGELKCFIDGTRVFTNRKYYSEIIPRAIKKSSLEVFTLEHYF